MTLASERFNQRTSTTDVTSRDVIGSGVSESVARMETPELAANESGPAQSALPAGTQLHGPADVMNMAAGQAGFENFTDEAHAEEKEIGGRAVGDYVKHSSFKIGSKLVVRIVPMATTGGTSPLQKNAAFTFPYAGLQSVAEISEEKYQLFEGFDAYKLLMFGRRPKIWSYQLMVLNAARPAVANIQDYPGGEAGWRAQNMDFADEMYRRYEAYYAGTKCVELNARAFLTYEDRIVEGQLVMMNMARNAQIPGAVNVNLTIVVSADTFTVSNLGQDDDQTLTDLLQAEHARATGAAGLSAPGLIAARLSPEQRLAAHADNQTITAEAQARATAIAEQALRAQAAIRDAKTALAAVVSAQPDAESRVVNAVAGSQEEADALAAMLLLDEQQAALESSIQQLAETEALATGTFTALGDQQQTSALEQATRDVDAAEATERAITENLKHAAEGDMSTAVATTTVFTEVLTSNDDGARTLVVSELTDPENPDSGVVVETRDVSDDPQYQGQVDGTETKKRTKFTPS